MVYVSFGGTRIAPTTRSERNRRTRSVATTPGRRVNDVRRIMTIPIGLSYFYFEKLKSKTKGCPTDEMGCKAACFFGQVNDVEG